MSRILVVGGGIGSLAAAALLGAAGHSVTVLEGAPTLGGKSRRIGVAGQRMDTGPSLFTFPGVWEELLRRIEVLGGREPGSAAATAGLTLERLTEVGTYYYRGGECSLPVPPGHPWHAAWERFAALHGGLGEDVTTLLTTDPLDRAAYPALGRLAGLYGHRLTTRSYLDSLPWLPGGLREVIAIHTLNAGVSPTRTPALYASMPAVMAHDGVWVPRGGVYELVLSLERLALEAGVEIRTGEPVERIRRGSVRTAQGTYPADAVVAGIDAQRVAGLLSGRAPRTPRKLSCSAVGLYAVLERPLPEGTPRHSVILPDAPAELYSALEAGAEPEQTMVFANYYPAGAVYPNAAPTLALLLTSPPNGRSYAIGDRFIAGEVDRVSRVLGLPERLDRYLGEHVIVDPAYFSAAGSAGGALYGAVRPSWLSGPFHVPAQWSPRRPWLWRVGASVHPGGGLPAVLGGAMMATGRLLRSLPPVPRP
ncbi:phytoene desaturase family protein [Arthrobacter sp. TMN-37]